MKSTPTSEFQPTDAPLKESDEEEEEEEDILVTPRKPVFRPTTIGIKVPEDEIVDVRTTFEPSTVSPRVTTLRQTQRPSLKPLAPAGRQTDLAPEHISFQAPFQPTRRPIVRTGVKSHREFEQPVLYEPPLGPPERLTRPDQPLADGTMPNCTLLGENYCILTKDYPM